MITIKKHNDNLYNTLLTLSRSVFFYDKIKLADNNERSLIASQVEIGVAVRMACLQLLFESRKINNP